MHSLIRRTSLLHLVQEKALSKFASFLTLIIRKPFLKLDTRKPDSPSFNIYSPILTKTLLKLTARESQRNFLQAVYNIDLK